MYFSSIKKDTLLISADGEYNLSEPILPRYLARKAVNLLKKGELKTTKNKNQKDKIQTKLRKYESQLVEVNTQFTELYTLYKRRNELFGNIITNFSTLFDNIILLRDYENKRLNDVGAAAKRLLEAMGKTPIPGGILNR
jgi:hypothetical protein